MTDRLLFSLALWLAWKIEPIVAVLAVIAGVSGWAYMRLTRALDEEERRRG